MHNKSYTRLKTYIVELSPGERGVHYRALAIGCGPESAIDALMANASEVESILRVRSQGLLRSLLSPDSMQWEYEQGQLEEAMEQLEREHPHEQD